MSRALATLFVLAGSAIAGDRWVPVSSGAHAGLVYVDTATVRADGDEITVWVKHDGLTDVRYGGKAVAQALRQVTYNCKNMTARVLSMAQYGEDNSVVSMSAVPSPVEPVVPDTVEEDVWRVVCAKPAG